MNASHNSELAKTPGLFAWKDETNQFSANGSLLVPENCIVLLFDMGIVMDLKEKAGEYHLTADNFPMLSSMRNLKVEGVEVYYFKKTLNGIKIGTKSPVHCMDKSQKMIKLNAIVETNVQLVDAKTFLTLFMGMENKYDITMMNIFLWGQLLSKISDLLDSKFKTIDLTTTKVSLSGMALGDELTKIANSDLKQFGIAIENTDVISLEML